MSVKENKVHSNYSKYVLLLGLILLVSIIFSGGVSAATDLTFNKINASDYGTPGKNIVVNTTVTNRGDSDSGGFYVKHYIQNEKQITGKTGDQIHVAIYGNRVVWEDWGNNAGIYMKDLSTGEETRITTHNKGQYDPKIYGNRIVWTDMRNVNADIYMLDLSTGVETQITDNIQSQDTPAIYGDRIVWTDYRNGLSDIYMKDLSTNLETKITSNPADQKNPDIYGDIIVWEDYRNGLPDIYMKDLSTGVETSITTNTAHQMNPVIYGNRVAWDDNRNVDMDIYMKDLSTGIETQITNNNADQYQAALNGDRIVWTDTRNGYGNIFMKNLTTGLETQITANNASESYSPAIYGDRVLWQNDRNNNWDIYLTDGPINLLETRWVSELAAGASNTAEITVRLPIDLIVGDKYYIGAIVDSTNMVVESDEFNNAILDPTPLNVVLPTEIILGLASGVKGDIIDLVATLKDSENVAIQSKNIQFSVDGIVVGSALTDINGVATLSYTIIQNFGTYTVLAEFLQDSSIYAPSSNTNNLDVIDLTPPITNIYPLGGIFNVTKIITLSMNEPGTIYYTTDGTTATTSSTKYTTPIIITVTTTLKYLAKDLAGNLSPIYTQKYTIDKIKPTVSANPLGGLYNISKTVSLKMSETGTIYYTRNGTTPTTSSTKYTTPIIITGTTTLKYLAKDLAGNLSPIYTQKYTIDKIKPTVSANPLGGLYNISKTVSLKMSETGTIYYTRNGTTPTTSSTKYTTPIIITSTTTLKYLAKDLAGNLSPIYTQKYTIDKIAPKISSTTPKNLNTGINRFSTTVIKLNENIKASSYYNKITIKNLTTGKYSTLTKTISGNTLYIKTTTTKTKNTWYQVTIPRAAIKDYAGNNLLATYTFKFKTAP